MKENTLHYLWLHKRINVNQLFTTKGEKIEILNFGQYLQASGPDFFNAQLIIGNQKWAGNIEMHIKSSDWYLHHHETDVAYDNVILHVVWENDTEIYRSNNSEIPVLELKYFVENAEIFKINQLLTTKKWINCENLIEFVDDFTFENWKERLFLERLEEKTDFILEVFEENDKNWETTCFILLAKNFGLNVNGDSFYKMAQNIPITVLRKEAIEIENLEALFFGSLDLLNVENDFEYSKRLNEIWNYQKKKYKLSEIKTANVQFFKLRPDNFPTIRLAQLASVYYQYQNVFSEIINFKNVIDIYNFFDLKTSNYWQQHYNFRSKTTKKKNNISKSFIELLIINTIVPLKFAYLKSIKSDDCESLIEFLKSIKPEKNTTIENFKSLNIHIESAFDSQAMLHLKKNYCDNKKCLNCAIGLKILNKI